ncbi:MAG TPA: amidohydrolase [Paenalcaligenes sp.]|nr:amidohydrolase [Paenalcaligenes sp.]
MNRMQPYATHVAIRDGRILSVGGEEQMRAFNISEIDNTFADKVLMPGLVEGHSHLYEGVAWLFVYIGYFDRRDPDGVLLPGLKSKEAIINRLIEAEQAMEGDEPLIAWGFDPLYFGSDRVTTDDLDKISPTRPVVILHASMHILNVNSMALKQAGIDRFTDVEGVARFANGEPNGELREFAAMFPVYRMIGDPFRTWGAHPKCLKMFGQIALNAGVTTATDLVNELHPEAVKQLSSLTAQADYPVRIVAAASGRTFGRDTQACVENIKNVSSYAHDKLHMGMIKLVIDGSIQGFTARLLWPGYHNGAPNGIWASFPPSELVDIIAEYHRAGVQMHIHTNGDEATEITLDALERALSLYPQFDHRHTLQHCQMATAAQFRRIAKLGLCVNLFSNHIFYWGDAHQAITLGPDRANNMNAAKTALQLGIPTAIHSDAPITPLSPLFIAWCAVNRTTATGTVLGEQERISIEQALYAITMGAAYTLHMDDQIGSIEVGKYADFCVLDQDPTTVEPMTLKDIKVLGTMVGRRLFECQ